MSGGALERAGAGPWAQAWERLRRSRQAAIGMALLGLILLACVPLPWLLGLDPANQQNPLFPGCSLLLQIASTVIALPNAAGAGAVAETIPNDVSFVGLPIYAQYVVLTTDLSTSDGLGMVVGLRP